MMKNHHLVSATGDAGWSGFITKLEYNAAEKGVHLVKLAQWFVSSKTCHCCGHKMSEMPLNKRAWQCPECGVEHDRDINAALNIERKAILELQAAGLVVSAHGGQRKSVIQTIAAQEMGSLARLGELF
ncbi:transposase [Escherichia coli]|nr:transposase [Escherichia coli]